MAKKYNYKPTFNKYFFLTALFVIVFIALLLKTQFQNQAKNSILKNVINTESQLPKYTNNFYSFYYPESFSIEDSPDSSFTQIINKNNIDPKIIDVTSSTEEILYLFKPTEDMKYFVRYFVNKNGYLVKQFIKQAEKSSWQAEENNKIISYVIENGKSKETRYISVSTSVEYLLANIGDRNKLTPDDYINLINENLSHYNQVVDTVDFK